jgi:hypothetical protein
MLKSFSESIIGFLWNNYTCLPQKDRCPRWFQGCPAWGFLFHGFCWTSAIWFILSPLKTISPIQIWKSERFCNLKSIPMFPVWSHGCPGTQWILAPCFSPLLIVSWFESSVLGSLNCLTCFLHLRSAGFRAQWAKRFARTNSCPYWHPQLCIPLFMYPHSWPYGQPIFFYRLESEIF